MSWTLKLLVVFLMGLLMMAACAAPPPTPTEEATAKGFQFLEFYSPF